MATAHKSRVLDMTQGDPFRLVLQFSMPLFCSNLLQQFYNLTDTALAGHLLGAAALAQIGATAALYGLIMNFAFGMNNGLALTVSRYFGAGDENGMRRAVGWMVTLSVGTSLVLTATSLLGRGALLTLLQVPAETWDGAAAYLTVILLGIPLTMLYNMEAALLRAVGNSITPLLFLLFSTVLNIGLDAAFMGPLGLGVRGAAIATVIARYIEAIYLILHTHRREKTFIFAQGLYKSLYLPGAVVKKILLTGTPLMLNELFWSVGTTMISQSYSTRGLTVVAATNIAGTVWNLFCVIMFAMGNAVSIIIGQQLGAGEIEEAKRTDNKLLFFTVVLHIGVGALIAITAPFIPLIYNTTPEVQHLTTELLFVAGAALPIQAFAHVTYFTIRSGGKTFITFLFDCVFTWLIPLPIAFFCSRYTALSIIGIYALVQFADIIKVIIGSILLRSGIWANNVVSDVD